MAELKKNLGYSSIGTLVQLYTGTILVIFLAKLLEVRQFGEFAFGLSLAGIISACGEFGYSLMTSRDVPQKKYELQPYVIDVLFQKTIITAVVIIVGLFYLRFVVGSTGEKFWVNGLFLLDGVILSYCMYFTALLQAVGKFDHASHSMVLNAILLTLVVLLLKFAHFSFPLLCVLFVLTHLARLGWMLVAVSGIVSFRKLGLNNHIQKYLLKNSWSFGLHYVIGTLYFTVDVQLIYMFLGETQVALYNSAFRVVSLLLLVPTLLLQVFLPYLSAEYAKRGQHFNDVVIILLKIMIYVGGAFSIGACLFDAMIIKILYSHQYLASTALFIPLLIMCIMRCMVLVYGMLLTISDNQVFRVKALVYSLLVSCAANYLLIPKFGIMGAAAATIITHLVLLGMYIYYTKKIYHFVFLSPTTLGLLVAVGGSLVLLKGYTENALATQAFAIVMILMCLWLFWRQASGAKTILNNRP